MTKDTKPIDKKTTEDKNNTRILSPLYAEKSSEGKGLYHNILEEALNDDDIKNIAITGPYGSGKSSVIESYIASKKVKKAEKKSWLKKAFNDVKCWITKVFNCINNKKIEDNNKQEFLKVSLANFTSNSDYKPPSPEKQEIINRRLEKEIESSILQQLYYQIPNKKIQYSRFNKIENLTSGKLFKISITTAFWVASIIYLITNKPFNFDFDNAFDFDNLTVWVNFGINLFFIAGIFCITRFSIKLIKQGKITKINVKSNSIELKSGSVLNKHLDELLYFFEVTDYNTVFIEDLDRFKNVELFEKLREINQILNNSFEINRTIKFVYAIRDDVFVSNNERTKFFDVIISIVPVMDSSNSNEKFKKLFTDCGYEKSPINQQFINDISLYIYDLRLLKNVVNEFIIYDKEINTNDHRKEISFALILFKNLYPKEFNKLHHKSGFLFDIFNIHKDILKESIITNIEDKLQKLNAEIDSLNEEKTKSIKALRSEYIEKILSEHSDVMIQGFNVNNNVVDKNEIINDDNFNEFITNPQITCNKYNPHNSVYFREQIIINNINFSDIEKEINSKYAYKEREANITKKNNHKLPLLTVQGMSLRSKIGEVKSMSLKALIKESITNEELSKLFTNIPSGNNSNHNKDLIKFFLRNGYISEEYSSYISYPDSLTPNDKSFLLNIKNEVDANIDINIDDIDEVIRRLSIDNYGSVGTYNYTFIYYLINTRHKLEIQTFFKEFKSDNQKIIDFAFKFIDKFDNKKGYDSLLIFINYMVKNFTTIWLYIDSNKIYKEEQKKRFLQLLLLSVDNAKVIKNVDIDSGGLLSEYILSLKDFFQLFPHQSKIENHLDELLIFFDNVTIDTNTEHSLVNHIYENWYYDRNEEMVLQLLQYKADNSKKEEIKKQFYTQNYTCIERSKCDNLIEYVNTDIEVYLDGLYLNLKAIQEESQEEYLNLINSDISIEHKENVLTKNKTKIDNLKFVEDVKIFEIILLQNKMKVSWLNIYAYFKVKDSEIDSILIDYINTVENAQVLSNADMQLISSEESSKIAYGILYTADILIETFEKLYENEVFQLVFEDGFKLEDIDKEKLKFLIKTDISLYILENYNYLKEEYSSLHINLIESNYLSFFNTDDTDYPSYKDLDLDVPDFILLMSSNNTSEHNKKKIINIIPNELLADKKLADKILDFISSESYYTISQDIINQLIGSGSNEKNKIKLLSANFDRFNTSDIQQMIFLMGYPFNKIIEKGAKIPKMDNVPYRYNFGMELEKRGYIGSCKIVKDKIILKKNKK